MAKEPVDTSEFIKRFRDLIKLSELHLSKGKIGRLRSLGREACDRLEALEQENKRLDKLVHALECDLAEARTEGA